MTPLRCASRRAGVLGSAGVKLRRRVRSRLAEGRGRFTGLIACWTALVAGFHAAVAVALTPDLELTQLGHSAWRVQDGVLPAPPTAIAQTNDGYIWIGTHAGLVRFDGVTFVPVVPPRAQTPLLTRITALYGAKDGSLWVGTSSQLGRWKDGQFRLYQQPTGFFADIGEGADGTIWTARQHTGDGLGPLCETQESKLICHGSGEGIPFPDGTALTIDAAGGVWIAGPSQLARWQGGQAQVSAPSALSRSEGLEGFKSIIAAPDGSIWSGVIRAGPGLGLQHFTNGTWRPEVRGDTDTSNLQVNTLLFDRDKSLWVGTANHGIYRLGTSRIDHFGVSDGLSADSVIALTEDREGNVWAITTMGVDKFRSLQVVTVSSRQGLSADEVDAVLASKSGAIWISNATALDKIDHGVVTSYGERDGLPGQSPTALYEDSRGRLWIGVDDGVALFENGRFTHVASPKGPVGAVLQFAEGSDSTVWAVTATLPSRLVQMNGSEVLESVSPPAGYRFSSFASAPNGGLWISAYRGHQTCDLIRYADRRMEVVPLQTPPDPACRDLMILDARTVLVLESQGIVMWRDGVARKLGVDGGLPCGNTYGSVLDGHGNLWLSTQCGLATVKSQRLLEWFDQPTGKLAMRLLDTSDGVLPGSAEFHPRASAGTDGKVWFANASILQLIDPEHGPANSLPPPVHVQGLQGDRHSYMPGSLISLPPLTRDVQIDFTAPSFVVPQRVQFRYRLEGWDKDWVQPVGRRQALYSNLPPGRYRFSVIASNDEGLWNTKGDSLEFRIPPAHYQTWWFRILCAAAILLLLQAAYTYRLRLAKAEMRKRLAARLSERERIARELHDTLLQSTQGLLLKFGAVANIIPAESSARRKLEGVLAQADDVIAEGRARVLGLRGEDQLSMNLPELISAHGIGLQTSATGFELSVVGQPVALNPVVADEVLTIAREGISNAFSHARAARVEVELLYEKTALSLKVRDDGAGMDPEIAQSGRAGHWGLVGMRERAKSLNSKLTVWTRHGSGTEIELIVPADTAYAGHGSEASMGLIDRMLRAFGFSTRRKAVRRLHQRAMDSAPGASACSRPSIGVPLKSEEWPHDIH